MSDHPSLAELLQHAQSGDEAARDCLFQKCRSYLAIVARTKVESWLRVKVDSSDLVQQTMLEAHRGFGQFRGTTEAEWLGWLRGILTNNARDFVRHYHGTAKRKIGREFSMDALGQGRSHAANIEPSDHLASPSELIMQRERELEVADAISELEPDYQEIILLRNLQQLPFDEIATRMGRSRPAVQMLWMRALKKLATKLKGPLSDDGSA